MLTVWVQCLIMSVLQAYMCWHVCVPDMHDAIDVCTIKSLLNNYSENNCDADYYLFNFSNTGTPPPHIDITSCTDTIVEIAGTESTYSSQYHSRSGSTINTQICVSSTVTVTTSVLPTSESNSNTSGNQNGSLIIPLTILTRKQLLLLHAYIPLMIVIIISLL